MRQPHHQSSTVTEVTTAIHKEAASPSPSDDGVATSRAEARGESSALHGSFTMQGFPALITHRRKGCRLLSFKDALGGFCSHTTIVPSGAYLRGAAPEETLTRLPWNSHTNYDLSTKEVARCCLALCNGLEVASPPLPLPSGRVIFSPNSSFVTCHCPLSVLHSFSPFVLIKVQVGNDLLAMM